MVTDAGLVTSKLAQPADVPTVPAVRVAKDFDLTQTVVRA